MFTEDDYSKWRFRKDAVHFNGGKVFFGWGHRCVDQPRLLVIDRYFKKDRSAKRSYLIDGKTEYEQLGEALSALATPPNPTAEEQALLAALPDVGWFRPETRAPYLPLAEMGLIEWGRQDSKVVCRRIANAARVEG